MTHQSIILIILVCSCILFLLYTIKNKPQYLVLLGFRGFFSMIFIHFMNYLCGLSNLPILLSANPISITGGALLGLPGVLLLYLSKIYLL